VSDETVDADIAEQLGAAIVRVNALLRQAADEGYKVELELNDIDLTACGDDRRKIMWTISYTIAKVVKSG
jgi:hypothetical protein